MKWNILYWISIVNIIGTLIFLKIPNKSNFPREYMIPLIMSLIIKYSIGGLYKGHQWTRVDIIYWTYILGLSYIICNIFSKIRRYKDVVTPIKTINLDSNITIAIKNENTQFLSGSSCLIPNPNKPGYIMNIRYVNYYIKPGGTYINGDKPYITLNKYVELDPELNTISEKWFDTVFTNRQYIGIEDVKIFYESTTEKIVFIGTGFHKNNNVGIVCGEYDTKQDVLLANETTSSFSNEPREKNWVYVNYKNETHIVYKWNPLQICKRDKETNQIHIVDSKELPNIFSHTRGSSSGFSYKNEIWFLVHLVYYKNIRDYYHVLVVFDENMNLQRYSEPFKFEGESIEFSLSIVVEDERVLINYSTWDRTTRIGVYDKKNIDAMLSQNMVK